MKSKARGGNGYLGLRDAVKVAEFIMTYTASVILCQHVSPLQLNFNFHTVLTDVFLKKFPR